MEFLRKKRKPTKSYSPQKKLPKGKNNKDTIINKKVKSETIKVDFMAKIKYKKGQNENNKNNIDKAQNIINDNNNIIFLKRKEEAIQIIYELKKAKINDENKILEKIKNCLNLDNTDKALIYDILLILSKFNTKDKYYDFLNKIKFCITDNFITNDKTNGSISQILPIKNIKLFKNDKEIIIEFINTMKYLDKVNEKLNKLKNSQKHNSNKIKNILTYKIRINNDNRYQIIDKTSKDNDINELYKEINNFLQLYLYFKDFDYYKPNQPTDYKNNNTLFLTFCFFKFYENIVEIHYTKGNNIILKLNEKKILIFSKIKEYRDDLIKDIQNNEGIINQFIEKKIDFFFFSLKTNIIFNLDKIIISIIKRQTPLTIKDIESFIKQNLDKEKAFYVNNNNLYLEYKGKKYNFQYNNYNKNLLYSLKDTTRIDFLDKLKWDNLCLINYFDNNDINYMKYLIKKILKSKLFKDIYNKYSNVKGIIGYYFDKDENIEDLFTRIHFHPYNENNFGIQAITFYNELKIITSGLPISPIRTEEEYYIYKILEVTRKIIIILHEICHFLKRALNLITNDKISNTTIDSENEDTDIIEAGRLFEKVVFNWENIYEKANRSQSKNKKNCYKNNRNSKILNVEISLKLLNPIIYEKNIQLFKNKLFNDKNVKEKEIDKIFLDYIKNIKFE